MEKNGENSEMQAVRRKRRLEHWQILAIMLITYDFIALMAAYFLALWGRFDFVYSQIPQAYLGRYEGFIAWYALGSVVLFWLFKLYNSMWRFASFGELIRILLASLLTSILHAVLITAIFGRMPITYYLWGMKKTVTATYR